MSKSFKILILVLAGVLGNDANASCKTTLDWNCFDATVAIVGRTQAGRVASLCSGVAINSDTIVTAGHCVDSLSRISITEIAVYLDAVVPHGAPAAAYGIKSSLGLNRLYDRSRSYHFHDRGLLRLDRALPSNLNYPLLLAPDHSLITSGIVAGATLERIGFGQRQAANGTTENRRTWNRPVIHEVKADTLVTVDPNPVRGDSGGPLFLFVPNEGLLFVGIHSTWDGASRMVYSPRVP